MTKVQDFLEDHKEELTSYTTAITRAHGAHHPEVFEVKKLYDELEVLRKSCEPAALQPIFEKLRQVTKNYEIPADVCPTFEATYDWLAQADYLSQE